MQEALGKSDQRDFPIPLEIRFENANSSDGIYETKVSPKTIQVALNKEHTLPRHSKVVLAREMFNLRNESLKLKHSPRTIADFNKIETSENGSDLDSKIWFMLNLENASMGKIKRIPTRWFIKILQDTKDIEAASQKRLIKGRRVLIEKLLSRVGSFDQETMKGVSIKSMLRSNEAKTYGVQY